MKNLQYVIVLGRLLASGYLCAAGWVGSKTLQNTSVPGQRESDGEANYYEFEGLTFADEASLKEFLQERTSGSWFPWVFSLPRELAPLLASMAFGLLGGAARLLRKLSIAGAGPTPAELFTAPLFGALIGLLLYFLALLLPAIFTSGKNPGRPETLAGLSLFGGVFSEQAYKWIEDQVVKLFPKRST